MLNTVFKKALKKTLEFEGVYSDHKYDSGGKTKFGIIEKEARRHGYKGSMKEMPLSFAEKIYKSDYWDKLKLDQVAEKYPDIAIELFDTAVNMGVGTSAKFLQKALNLMNRNGKSWSDISVDGVIGNATMRALTNIISELDKNTLLKLLNALQGARYIAIMEKRESQEVFCRGWLKRIFL